MSESRQKKITVNFFLNKNVQPDSIVDGKTGKEKDAYPLYISVTYNRKNMQFKSNYGLFYSDLKSVEAGLLELEENLINKIIRFEHSSGDDDYEMKGLSKRYSIYANSLITILEAYLKPKIRLAILSANNELFHALDLNLQSGKNKVMLLHKAALLLFEDYERKMSAGLKTEIETYQIIYPLLQSKGNYDFPTMIDWMDGKYKQVLREQLEKLGRERECTRDAEKLIDLAVVPFMKQLLQIKMNS